jgi:argininosuccinate lyase
MPFDPEYVSSVLRENFEDAKTLFLGPLMAVQYAHLVMLAERRLISAADAHQLRVALDTVSTAGLSDVPYDGGCEDLFFHIERALAAACGADTVGRLNTARSRNDVDMTLYRMRQREWTLDIVDRTNRLRGALLVQVAQHGETVFAAHTHTQPAQPTTMAHYLLAVVEQLERDVRRLRAAFASTNRCPLGACAITGTGFPIDRTLTSDLLGFAEPTGNTYGSIATVDYALEGVGAVSILLVGLGRVVQDLLLWCTAEFGYLRLSDGFVQRSSIMPQKRNPVALEHARAIASRGIARAAGVAGMVHNIPFGDVVDTEDDLQPVIAACFADACRAVALVAAVCRDAVFDVERLAERAGQGGTTATELADHLVRTDGIAFRSAHLIAARVVCAADDAASRSPAARLASASAEVLGRALHHDDGELAHVMSPRHFVELRGTHGGPAPHETARAAGEALVRLQSDLDWSGECRARLASAEARLRARSAAL